MPNKDRVKKNQTNNEYYHRNKERILPKQKQSSKERYWANRELFLERAKASREKHYETKLFVQVKSRAALKNIPFNLEESDIIIPEKCPYLEVPLTRTQGKGRVWTNASIDRIDPTKGYVKGNIQIISTKANVMKNSASQKELCIFAKNILKQYDEEIQGYLKCYL